MVVACAVSGTLLLGVGLLMFFGARPLVGMFLGPEQYEVAAVAPPLLRIIAFAMPFLALMQVLTGALRGAGDTRWPLAFTFIGFLAVRIPLAWLFTQQWDWGIEGAWYAMAADLLLRCGLITGRFLRGGWTRVEV